MRNTFFSLTGVIVASALILAACGGGDDDPDAQAQAEDQSAAQASEEQTQPEGSEDAQAQSQAEAGEQTEEPVAEEQAQAEDEQAAEEQAVDEQAEEEQAASDLPPDQLAYGGQIRSSVLTPDEPAQFRFEGSEGDLIRIRVDGLAGMDPITTLLEPNRTEVVTNDDESVANRDSLIITTLPSSGLQVIRVAPFDIASAGEFIVSVELLEPETVDDSAIISIGDTINARLHTPGDVDTFEFAGTAGQVVRIRADGVIGADTYMEVFGPDGNFLALNDDSGHALDAEVELELTSSGNYRVDVYPAIVGRPAGERHRIGDYVFTVVSLPATVEASGETATQLAGLALTYLDAIQQGDSITIFGLSGPEQIDQTGWQSAEDVSRDLSRQQDIVTAGEAGDITAEILGDRARVRMGINVPGGGLETLRFDAINVNGQWLVDFVERFAAAPATDAAGA